MSDILVEFDKYISTNKDVLSVLPINTKKNRKKYIQTATNHIHRFDKAEFVKRINELLENKE